MEYRKLGNQTRNLLALKNPTTRDIVKIHKKYPDIFDILLICAAAADNNVELLDALNASGLYDGIIRRLDNEKKADMVVNSTVVSPVNTVDALEWIMANRPEYISHWSVVIGIQRRGNINNILWMLNYFEKFNNFQDIVDAISSKLSETDRRYLSLLLTKVKKTGKTQPNIVRTFRGKNWIGVSYGVDDINEYDVIDDNLLSDEEDNQLLRRDINVNKYLRYKQLMDNYDYEDESSSDDDSYTGFDMIQYLRYRQLMDNYAYGDDDESDNYLE